MAKRRRGINPIVAFMFVLIVSFICFATSFLILTIQKSELSKAESSMPESAISSYLKKIKNNDFDSIYQDSLSLEKHLNSKEDYIEAMKKIYGDIDISKLKYVKSMDEEDIYQIVHDNKLLAKVKLIRSTESNKWIASTIFKGDNNYRIEVIEGLKLKVNGIDIDESYIKERGVNASNYNQISDSYKKPKVDVYEVNNLISEPVLSSEADVAVIKSSLNNTYYVGNLNNDSSVEESAKTIAKTVAQYPTKDTTIGAVGSVSLKDSEFYKRVSTLDNQWYASHGTATFSDIEVKDVIRQSDNSAMVNISLNYYIASSTASKTYHIGYQMSLLKDGNSWKIAGFTVDNDLNQLNNKN